MQNKHVFHMVGHAHIDPVWLWRWQEGYSEIKATFRSALDRLYEYPDTIFTSSAAAYYQWVEDNAYDMFEEIREMVRQGRWIIIGGWWVEPDCNIPCGESFARHSLYGLRYFKEKLGVDVKIGFNADSFGHSGMLPQIIKKSGMNAYVFMRPMKHEKILPQNLFMWEGADGTRIPAFRLTQYATFYDTGEFYKEARKLSEEQKIDFMYFYGVGNHGGGPTVKSIKYIQGLQAEPEGDTVIFSSPVNYFDSIGDISGIPVVKGDLKNHAVGCYSSLSQLKKQNRKAESRLIAGEKFAVIAKNILNYDYDDALVENAWHKLLFGQFHDIMGGCCIRSAYDDALEACGSVLYDAGVLLNRSLEKISWAIDTSSDGSCLSPIREQPGTMYWECEGEGTPLVVFNPHSWDARSPVCANKLLSRLTDYEGNDIPIQKIRGEQTNGQEDLWNTLFMANVPAFGYSVYRMFFGTPNEALSTSVNASADGVIENAYIRLEIAPDGSISRLYDKISELELLKPGQSANMAIYDETDSDTWSHDIHAFDKEIGKFDRNATIKVVESGPLRVVLQVFSEYGDSRMRQDYVLYNDRPDVEVRLKINWREEHKMLKFKLPLSIENSELVSEIPFGFMKMDIDGIEKVGQQWINVSGSVDGKRCGVAVVNDSTYAFSAKDLTLCLTVLRSPIFADHVGKRDSLCEFTEQGEHFFRYAIIPHNGDWRDARIPQKAAEFNVSMPVIVETFHAGALPLTYKGIRVSEGNVIVQAFKKAENRDGHILRCCESYGKGTTAEIEIPCLSRVLTIQFAPLEIKTIFIPNDAAQSGKEVYITEYEI